jgi:hypothetical protein
LSPKSYQGQQRERRQGRSQWQPLEQQREHLSSTGKEYAKQDLLGIGFTPNPARFLTATSAIELGAVPYRWVMLVGKRQSKERGRRNELIVAIIPSGEEESFRFRSAMKA